MPSSPQSAVSVSVFGFVPLFLRSSLTVKGAFYGCLLLQALFARALDASTLDAPSVSLLALFILEVSRR